MVSVCEIVAPEPAVAPVMPPVTVPIVHAKLLGVLDVNPIFVVAPLQIEADGGVEIVGVG